ncbi:PAS domain S-box protein [Rhizobium sp. KVB221]|uniref:histidine kinase n=1 Tax=Rhizobium setariae TaxID=2801340 RepID=A0A937CNW8_9HYPH|nr:ATP-binding protein [Rhizobium setariae]MBL0371708.1 PAS domain S-box protein [Rhizobium setariae]
MPQVQYPFIDIAVHPSVRARLAAGDAIVLFSRSMDQVLWANGEGAAFFGFGDIYGLMDDGPNRGSVAFRQLTAAASQLREVGDTRGLTIRTSSGFQSAAVSATASLVEIRKDEIVVIFTAPVAANAQDPAARIAAMLRGFDDPDTHMAVLDGEGTVLDASAGFSAIGIAPETTRGLIAALAHTDGLIKRPIASAAGYLPAAIGTVSQDPPLHLLFCVETMLGRMDPPPEQHLPRVVAVSVATVAAATQPATPAAEKTPDTAFDDADVEADPATEAEPVQPIDAEVEEVGGAVIVQPEAARSLLPAESIEADEASDLSHDGEDAAEMTDAELADVETSDDLADLAAIDGAAAIEGPVDEPQPISAPEQDLQHQPIVVASEDQQPEASVASVADEPTEEHGTFVFRGGGRPVRFVWKLDPEGRFAEVSDEFMRTVGPNAGNINGLGFKELAEQFNLDQDGEIGRLLERRDTWSGRMIRWPVEGTNLVVPVDLAALPTYSRNREFDGFRGFGIVRVGDAEEDPAALGLTLGRPDAAAPVVDADAGDENEVFDESHAEGAAQDETTDDSGVESLDEFRGEVPALEIASNPLETFSRKIVQLEERRAKAREGLSQNEQAAFREIARQLEPFGKRPNELVTGQPMEDTPDANDDVVADADVQNDAQTMKAGTTAVEALGAEDSASKREQEDVAKKVDEIDEDEFDDLAEASQGPGMTASAADQVPLAILIHAGDRLIHANTEFRRLTGYNTIEALEAAGGLESLIARHEGAAGIVHLVRADRVEVPVTARLQSVKYEGATALMLTLAPEVAMEAPPVSFEEDPEMAHKLATLKIEAEELRSILETATDGVVILDTDGRIRSLNRSASALFNFDDGETRGKPFAMLFAHESQKAVQDYLAGLAGHGVASVLNDGREVIGREASGGFIPLFMTMGRMPGSNSYCAVIRDITQWKRSEEELKTAKRAAETANQHKSDFLARVSHEIRTPLNAIIGFSDMIASEHFGPAGHPRYVEYANDIGRSGRHVLDIVNDLLDISKIEAGEMDVEFAAVTLNDCVSEAVSLVQQQANAQRVIIRTSLSQSVPDVVADLRSIKQIAINILANAIRFTPSGGQIVVSTAYETSGSVTLRIRDTGVGMSKAELEQAMKPFGQVQPGARKRGDGTGLGLPLTKAMTEANRATFAIQSSHGEGTLVEITFPPQRVLAD